MSAEDFWRGMTPALFIPVVGNVLPALAGVTLGHPVWAAAQYGVAIFLWPIALAGAHRHGGSVACAHDAHHVRDHGTSFHFGFVGTPVGST
jgi:hypothetical protein